MSVVATVDTRSTQTSPDPNLSPGRSSVRLMPSPADRNDPVRDVDPLLDQLDGVLEELSRARTNLTEDQIQSQDNACAVLDRLDRIDSLVMGFRSQVLVTVEKTRSFAGQGDRDVVAWRARTSRQGSGAGASQLRTARTLANMPQVEQALIDGRMTSAHVTSLARVSAQASPAVEELLTSVDGQTEVVALARHHDAQRFSRVLTSLVARWDPSAHQTEHDTARAARFLFMSHTPDGTYLKGRLDPWAGKKLRMALETVSGRPAADDDRSPEQRSADALETLADHVLDTPPGPPSASAERPHVSVVISERTWNAVRSAGPAPRTSTPAGGKRHLTQILPGCEPVRDLDGLTLPPSELGRLLCDCELSRVVLGSDSAVLDHGRDQRLFSPTQRRSILIRDGGCAWPGCSTPARYTEIHHNTWWHRDHGYTNIDNGIALCRFHHHEIHRHDYTISRDDPTAAKPGTNRLDPDRIPPDRPPDDEEGHPIEYTVRRPDGTIVAAPARSDTG